MLLLKCCIQYASKFGKHSSGHRTGKRSLFIPVLKKGNAKECLNYHTIALISHASKVMLKFLQARLQQYVNWELPDVQAGFRKGSINRDQIANTRWSQKKQNSSRKYIYFCFTDYAKAYVWIATNSGKLLEMGITDHLTCLLRNLHAGQEVTVRTGHGQRMGSKLGKEYVKAVHCHLAYLTYMQSISRETRLNEA